MKRLLLIMLGIGAVHVTGCAHVVDQYLQHSQITILPASVGIELKLTPGVQAAECVFGLIDTDGDGSVSPSEAQAYAQRVSRDLEFAVHAVRTRLVVSDFQLPTRQEMQEGVGTIRLTLRAAVELADAGSSQLYFRNNHMPEIGVYLVNALVPPSSEIRITGQERDPLQREIRLKLRVAPAGTANGRYRMGVFMFCACLALLVFQVRPFRQFIRENSYRKTSKRHEGIHEEARRKT